MSDDPTTPAAKPVSFGKRGAADGARTRPSLLGRGKPNLAADGSPMPPPPKQVRYAAVAIAVSCVSGLVASLVLYGQKSYVLRTLRDSNNKLKASDRKTDAQLHHAVHTYTQSFLLQAVVLALALSFVVRGVLRGRHWSRWTVLVLWILATLTGTPASILYLVGITSDTPIALKIPTVVCAASLIVAVAYTSLKPSVRFFLLSKPPRPDGAPARRGGLFGPRPPRATAAPAPAAPRTSVGREAAERSRAKQRATSESVAKGAELARARAKASKSRRTGV